MKQPSPFDRVSVVSVCYNSTGVAAQMLASIPGGCEIVLVDNGSKDVDELEALAAKFGARLIKNGRNLGFGAACNIGAAQCSREFILFENPDTVLDAETIAKLVVAADRYPDAAAFNPRISRENGAEYFKRGSCLLPRAQKMPRGWPEQDCEVSILSGASLMVRKASFDAVGGFDPKIFLYHEDDDLALRLQQQCGKLMFIRNAHVTHAMGRSTVRSPETASLKAFHMGQSRVYAAQKHGRPFAFLTALGLALLQLLSPVVLISRRKRAKQAAFLKGILKASELTRP